MPALKALSCQIIALLATLALSRSELLPPLDLLPLACLQGVLAAFMSLWLRAARWWLPLQLGFMPTIVLALRWSLPPWLYFLGFCVLGLLFWTTFRSQVPLYLSGRPAIHRLARWLPDKPGLRVLDLGCGTGSFMAGLGRLRPDWQVSGIENAPLPYWIARQRLAARPNTTLRRGDFWSARLNDVDVVYAFLSPVPMTRLWQKARREMAPGSWLVSNSFEIPGLRASTVLRTADDSDRTLYCYQIPGATRGGDSG